MQETLTDGTLSPQSNQMSEYLAKWPLPSSDTHQRMLENARTIKRLAHVCLDHGLSNQRNQILLSETLRTAFDQSKLGVTLSEQLLSDHQGKTGRWPRWVEDALGCGDGKRILAIDWLHQEEWLIALAEQARVRTCNNSRSRPPPIPTLADFSCKLIYRAYCSQKSQYPDEDRQVAALRQVLLNCTTVTMWLCGELWDGPTRPPQRRKKRRKK